MSSGAPAADSTSGGSTHRCSTLRGRQFKTAESRAHRAFTPSACTGCTPSSPVSSLASATTQLTSPTTSSQGGTDHDATLTSKLVISLAAKRRMTLQHATVERYQEEPDRSSHVKRRRSGRCAHR